MPSMSLREHLGLNVTSLSVFLKGLNFRRIQGVKRTFRTPGWTLSHTDGGQKDKPPTEQSRNQTFTIKSAFRRPGVTHQARLSFFSLKLSFPTCKVGLRS